MTALLFLSIGGCTPHHKHPSKTPKLKVESAIARADTLAQTREFVSILESNFSAVIQPRVNAWLLSREYEEGMPVKRGQLLFRLDPSQLNTQRLQAEAVLTSARAQLLEARNNHDRALPLARIEAISQSDLDQYTYALAAAEASVRSAEQALRNARLNVGYTRIVAPIDGIASACEAHAGDYVGPGTRFEVLATLSNNDSLSAVVSIPTREYLSLTEGGRSYENQNLLRDISLYLSDGSIYPYPGSYDYTLKDIAQGEGVIQLALLFPNPEGRLKAGAFARIRAQIGESRAEVLVPQRAVSQAQGVNAVWVIRADSSVEYRPVELGPTYDSLWSIRQGVQAGERVVTEGLLKLHQGERVSF